MNYNYGVRKKSVVSVILLTFITCGIYTFFWMYQTTKELAEYSEDNRLSPETSILLSILTCGLYQIYWWYRIADVFMGAQQRANMPRLSDNKILFVVLSLFGFDFINMAILQGDMNQMWEAADQNVMMSSATSNDSSDSDDWVDY